MSDAPTGAISPASRGRGHRYYTGDRTHMHMTLLLLQDQPLLERIGWAAGRRGNLLLIAVADLRPRSWLFVKRALLEALTDDEYVAYESLLPVPEQHRRMELTWERRDLSRRAAMLEHLYGHTDDTYAAYETALPPGEMRRRIDYLTAGRVDLDLPTERQPALV